MYHIKADKRTETSAKLITQAVLALMEEEKVRDALAQLRRETTKWRGETLRTLSVSAGYALASKNKGLSAEKLVGVADKAMYEAKAAYYRNSGRDRRRH